jgi:16S rRNA processing protein RimM
VSLRDPEDFIRVGAITKPHGIRGEVFVFLETDFPDWVAKRETLFLKQAETITPYKVLQSRQHQKKWVLKLEGISDRNAAEAARGTELFVSQEEARELFEEDDDYFLNADLIGLAVLDEREPARKIGEVTQIFDLPMQQLLEIRKPDGETFLVPFVAAIVAEIVLEEGHILVNLPEGLDSLESEKNDKD